MPRSARVRASERSRRGSGIETGRRLIEIPERFRDDLGKRSHISRAFHHPHEGVNHREKRFVESCLLDLDPKRAAIDAGYSASVAASKAYQWEAMIR
jgi:hypothetical protein